MYIILLTVSNILALLFNFVMDYVTLEKHAGSISGIWVSLIMFSSIGYSVNHLGKNELEIYTLICFCMCFLYFIEIEMVKKKFQLEKVMDESNRSIWKGQLVQLLLASVIALPSFILFLFIPKANHQLMIFIYLLIVVSVSLVAYIYARTKAKKGEDVSNDTFILCYYFLSILCVVSEIDLGQAPMLIMISGGMFVVYDIVVTGTQAYFNNKNKVNAC